MNEIKTQNKIGVKGAYAYQVIDDDTGDVLIDVPEQTNLILDGWFDSDKYMDNAYWIVLGSGVVTPPSVSDTDMGNQIKKSTNTSQPSQRSELPHPSGRMFRLGWTVDFTGFSGDDVSEIGLRRAGSGTTQLVTRSLIKDSNGNPSSITVNQGQTLRITYAIYLLFPFVVSTGTFATPYGNVEWSYGVTDLSSNILTGNSWWQHLASEYGAWSYGVQLGWGVSSNAGASITNGGLQKNVDIPNRKVTLTASFPATTSDRVLGQTSTVAGAGFLLSSGMFSFKVVGSTITLPANYDFTISWEVTWGRLP